MLILRIKQAECALADGRLDEAFELLRADDLRSHRRGQDLVGLVADALAKRGQEHLAAGRLPLAESDCQKAQQLAGNLPEVARLREGIGIATQARRAAEQRQAQAIAAARQQIQQGHLTLGGRILKEAEPNANAAAVLQDLAARKSALETMVTKATEALDRDDWEGAVRELAQAAGIAPADGRVRELIARATSVVVQRVSEAIDTGRLDLAEALLRRLGPIASQSIEAEQLRRSVDQCRLAWRRIETGEIREAEQILRRVRSTRPEAKWIEAAVNTLAQTGQAMDQLRSGPLALLADAGAMPGARPAARPDGVMNRWGGVAQAPAAPRHPVTLPPPPPPPLPAGGPMAVTVPPLPEPAPANPPEEATVGEGMTDKFLIQVDGVGGFYLMRNRRVTIGPLSSSHMPDLALMADAATPTVQIERSEEDYFLRSHLPIGVNDRLTTGKLLVSGDRVALSPRCRFAFMLPSAASTTAVLDLTGARLGRADVKRIVLLGRELIIGAGAGAHIRCDDMPEPAMLFARDGALYCQSKSDISVDERPASGATPIPLGAHVQVGTVSFVVTRL